MGLILVTPIYAGEETGYSEEQKAAFAGMDAVASRAVEEGIQVLRSLYANLPSQIREKAFAIVEGFDAASVVATSHFVASGAQCLITIWKVDCTDIHYMFSAWDCIPQGVNFKLGKNCKSTVLW